MITTNVFKLAQNHGLRFDLAYSNGIGWWLRIKGLKGGEIVTICDIENDDLSYVLAKGEVMVKEWLIENQGGYLNG